MSRHTERRQRILRTAGIIGAFVVIAVIIWIDIATGIWQQVVILSGLAAGLVTFLLTVLVVDRAVARATERRWAPVTRLALTEFLHGLADEDRSEIARGRVIARALPVPGPEATPAELRELRELVVTERSRLTESLSRWVEFLSSSGDNETALRHVAGIALALDRIRDAALEQEEHPTAAGHAALHTEVSASNARFAELTAELEQLLAADAAEARRSAAQTWPAAGHPPRAGS
ncbi:hypothetical protein [Leucobacter luti]|uniref:Uncharacterized protein n=1 Tax=Leucobacter luti TaxID=340320 RepID=A0A4Q7TY22_9MICO|nr:hypothetical protein [Leucobacter luti]MBL3698736.1 hypothetical protein [Leucobacter luti]RZT66111.1 hypothetical protein EV139_1537 [Leucobacter luti]